MKGRAEHRAAKPNYSASEIEGWITMMRDNKWTNAKLAKHLGKGFQTVQQYIDRYYAGELK